MAAPDLGRLAPLRRLLSRLRRIGQLPHMLHQRPPNLTGGCSAISTRFRLERRKQLRRQSQRGGFESFHHPAGCAGNVEQRLFIADCNRLGIAHGLAIREYISTFMLSTESIHFLLR
jgi:hypothetical protein